MKKKIINSILRFLLLCLLVMLIVSGLVVAVGIHALILIHFGTSALAGVFLFLYITFLVAGVVVLRGDIA